MAPPTTGMRAPLLTGIATQASEPIGVLTLLPPLRDLPTERLLDLVRGFANQLFKHPLLNAKIVTVKLPVAGTPFPLHHGLFRFPIGFLVVNSPSTSNALQVIGGDAQPTLVTTLACLGTGTVTILAF